MNLAFAAFLAAAQASSPDEVTYSKQVAPILFKHCAGCHRAGEVGPFPLLAYKDAAKRASHLKEVAQERRMPPWKAEAGPHPFADERRLSDAEIALIAKWADSGAKEGNPADLPPLPKFPEGWQLGEPDLVLKMAKPFAVRASGKDVYRCFVIPIPVETDRTVAAVEFRPGNRKVVHHAILYLDSMGQGRAKDKDGAGFEGFGGPGILPTGGLGGWAPGSMPRFLPEGVGQYLRKGSDLVLQIHYHPSGKEEEDQSQLGVYFTKKPAEKIVTAIAVRSQRLYIPAGEKRHAVSAESEPIPVDVRAISITPHMHMIGREMAVSAALPDGKSVPLIRIPDWDFNWQGAYQYQKPVLLPKGSVIKVQAFYDNSADNPQNPNTPPKPVRWGEQTTDEMCLLGIMVVTDSLADLKKVSSMRGNALGRIFAGGPPDDGEGKVPPGGLAIPERFKAFLVKYDKDADGKLSQAEVDAMPAALRDRVKLLSRFAAEEP